MTVIVHVFPASPFLRFTVDTFETAVPGGNSFLVFGADDALARHVSDVGGSVTTFSPTEAQDRRVADAASDADIVIAHSMNSFAARAMLAARPGTLRVWSGWGGDYYGNDWFPLARQLERLTARYHREQHSIPGKLVRLRRRLRGRGLLQQVARATDVFSAPIPEDYAVFRRRYPRFAGRYAQLNYASVEDSLALGPDRVTGDDILVGNSATLANNHFDVFERLRSANLDGRRVVVPLSYGDPELARAVIERGKQAFGTALEPLTEFLGFNEYQQVLARCGVVVMGHRRQQGLGNVGSALWRGAHLYLNERSPVRSFLASRGVAFSTLEGRQGLTLPSSSSVNDRELEANRRVLMEFWGRERVIQNIRELVAARASGDVGPT